MKRISVAAATSIKGIKSTFLADEIPKVFGSFPRAARRILIAQASRIALSREKAFPTHDKPNIYEVYMRITNLNQMQFKIHVAELDKWMIFSDALNYYDSVRLAESRTASVN